MVKVEHLVKRYGQNYALNDISFEIGEGEIVGLLGPNGAGKSTTMNILTGYLSSTSGSAEIGGINILEHPIEAKSMIGFLPEQPPLYIDMTVWEYLCFVYDLKSCDYNKKAHLNEVCELVKITDVKNRLIKNLSKGFKQRVGLAAALLGEPDVLILDEPTVGLDPAQLLDIRELIRDYGKEHTVIISSHILSEIALICDKVLIISGGCFVAEDTPEALSHRASGQTLIELTAKCSKALALEILKSIKDINIKIKVIYTMLINIILSVQKYLIILKPKTI
jgi:ABC-2 type transport system ATP-binding protein